MWLNVMSECLSELHHVTILIETKSSKSRTYRLHKPMATDLLLNKWCYSLERALYLYNLVLINHAVSYVSVFFTKHCPVARIITHRGVGIAFMICRTLDPLIYGDILMWNS